MTLNDLMCQVVVMKMTNAIQYDFQGRTLIADDYDIKAILTGIAQDEMIQAQMIVDYMATIGMMPPNTPNRITLGESTGDRISLDIACEKASIDTYSQIIDMMTSETINTNQPVNIPSHILPVYGQGIRLFNRLLDQDRIHWYMFQKVMDKITQ